MRATEHGSDPPLDVNGGATPQLRSARVLQDGAGVVVAVGAEGSTDQIADCLVMQAAFERTSVRAREPGSRAGPTRRGVPGGADGAEPRRVPSGLRRTAKGTERTAPNRDGYGADYADKSGFSRGCDAVVMAL